MSKKYELIASDVDGLYRVKALKDFGNVKAGDVGGYVAGEHNLSHDGNCWVYDGARVFDNAWVTDDVRVFGNAHVYGNPRASGVACIYENARLYGDAYVHGNVRLRGDCSVYGDARVFGNAWIRGNASVFGSAHVFGNAHIESNADVSETSDYFVVGPDPFLDRFTTVHKTVNGYSINHGNYSVNNIKDMDNDIKRECSYHEHTKSYYEIVSGSIALWVKQNVNNT